MITGSCKQFTFEMSRKCPAASVPQGQSSHYEARPKREWGWPPRPWGWCRPWHWHWPGSGWHWPWDSWPWVSGPRRLLPCPGHGHSVCPPLPRSHPSLPLHYSQVSQYLGSSSANISIRPRTMQVLSRKCIKWLRENNGGKPSEVSSRDHL